MLRARGKTVAQCHVARIALVLTACFPACRLVKNSDGQPKGFGFCEFRVRADTRRRVDSAVNAVSAKLLLRVPDGFTLLTQIRVCCRMRKRPRAPSAT